MPVRERRGRAPSQGEGPIRCLTTIFLALLCSISTLPPTATPAASPAHIARPARSAGHSASAAKHRRHHRHSRFTPDWGSAHYWTSQFFGRDTWQTSLMMCLAHRESGYVLAATHQNTPASLGVDHGPWQVNDVAHPWVNFYRIVRSWKYAAAVSWHLSAHGTDFSPWGGRCSA